jgi:hypothetical protein
MDGVPGFRPWAVQEYVDALDMPINEARLRQRFASALEIDSAQENIDIACVAHRSFIHLRDPRSYGVTIYDCVRDLGFLQRCHRSAQPFAHLLHGRCHPFPGEITDRMDVHVVDSNTILGKG